MRNEGLFVQFQNMSPQQQGMFIEELREKRRLFVINSVQPEKKRKRRQAKSVTQDLKKLSPDQLADLIAQLEDSNE